MPPGAQVDEHAFARLQVARAGGDATAGCALSKVALQDVTTGEGVSTGDTHIWPVPSIWAS